MTIISFDSLPDAVGVTAGDLLRCASQTNGCHERRELRAPALTRVMPRKSFVIDCWLASGSWICAVCTRLGRDYRRLFCPFGVGV